MAPARTPEVAAIHPQVIRRLEDMGRARGVLIIEPDAERLYDTLLQGSRGFRRISERRRRAVAELDRLYGSWLAIQAQELGVQWVPSQPWNTLADRVMTATAKV
jgi:hypothetical protein